MGKKYQIGDLVGPHKVKLLKRLYIDKNNKWVCLFECPVCGSVFQTVIGNVGNGDTSSCGCVHKKFIYELGKAKKVDKQGQKIGKLTVIKDTGKRKPTQGVIWLCKCDCGRYCEVSNSILLNKFSCGKCNVKSIGEYTIIQILEKHNFNYIKEKTFEDCINPKTNAKLRFDFYLPDYNILIEYDGEQHFKSNSKYKTWNTPQHLKEQQFKDNIKNQWCTQHNIPLIRIPYTDCSKLKESDEYLLEKINNYV